MKIMALAPIYQAFDLARTMGLRSVPATLSRSGRVHGGYTADEDRETGFDIRERISVSDLKPEVAAEISWETPTGEVALVSYRAGSRLPFPVVRVFNSHDANTCSKSLSLAAEPL